MKFTRFGSSLLLGTALLLASCAGTSSNSTSMVQSPVIMSPVDGLTNVPLNTSFFWLSVNKATYEFQLSTDSGFLNISERHANLKNNKYSLTSTLLPETIYYWRVRATVRGKAPSFWAVAKFTTSPNVSAPRPVPIQGE